MTTIPKPVIQVALVIVGLIVLGIIAADAVLIATGNPTLPAQLEALAPVGLGGILGLLSLRTLPDVDPGVAITGSSITNTGDPADAPAPLVGTLVQNTAAPVAPSSTTPAPAGSQGMTVVDPATIPGYALGVTPPPASSAAHATEPVVSADYSSQPATSPAEPHEPQQ